MFQKNKLLVKKTGFDANRNDAAVLSSPFLRVVQWMTTPGEADGDGRGVRPEEIRLRREGSGGTSAHSVITTCLISVYAWDLAQRFAITTVWAIPLGASSIPSSRAAKMSLTMAWYCS